LPVDKAEGLLEEVSYIEQCSVQMTWRIITVPELSSDLFPKAYYRNSFVKYTLEIKLLLFSMYV
jgi:hypothetical protein